MNDPNYVNGTVELMLLAVIDEGPSYGYEITQSVLSRSGGRFDLKEGSLYPALHRLERQGFIASEWGTSDNNRRARYYELTTAGRARLAEERQAWKRMSRAVELILAMEAPG